jgi:hypothetical protein
MKKLPLLVLLTLLSMHVFSQKKKKLTLEEQVAIAKIQEQQAKELQKPLTITGAKLPTFQVRTSSDKIMQETEIPKDHSLLVILFNPTCDHCVKACKTLLQHQASLMQTTVLFMCIKDYWADLPLFIKDADLHVEKNPQFIVSADHSDIAKDLFNYNGIPQIMIYNKEKVLQKILYQQVNMDSIFTYIAK